jgi:hypothetical protein
VFLQHLAITGSLFLSLQLLFCMLIPITPSKKRNSNLADHPASPANRKTARP